MREITNKPSCARSFPHQDRLEEDFKLVQELLEEREAEILQLTEEVDDALPLPLPTPPTHQQTVNLEELNSRLRTYEEQVEQLSTSLQRKTEEVEQLSRSLQQRSEEVEQLSRSLQRKNEEVVQLTTQLEHIHIEMKERLSQASRETTHLEQQYQQHISDLKEQHIAKEKKLCREYEERMARQVEDVIQHLNKKNEAAMMRQQEAFEATLRQAVLDRRQTERESEERQEASPSPLPIQSPPQPQSPQQQQQTAAQLCASVDGLIAGLKQELEKAGQLDLSMASLMRAGESREASTQASSNLSDGSDADEPNSVTGKIQQLMSKIHKEGIEVLTLIDILFLCQHHTQLDSSQSSVLASSSLIAKSLLERGGGGGVREQTQLMHNLAAVEEELTKKEQEMKRKIEVMEFQLDQERMSGSEWKMSYESEKQHTRELMEQLRKERLTVAEQVSELTLLRSQLIIIRQQHQKLQEENCNIIENQEKKDKLIESLQTALQIERSNFSQVSKVLTEERNVSSLTHAEQEAIIKDLRNSLEKERERIVGLCNHLERMSNQTSTTHPLPSTTASTTPIGRHNKSASTEPTIEELQIQLALERERYGELKMTCERERLQAVSLKEQATAERSQSKVEVRRAEGRLADLMRNVRSLETEKERLARQMSHEKDRLHYQDSRIRELEGEVRRLETDTQAQSEAHQAVADRMREEGTQLHLAYTRTLTKLGEVEAEVCELRHKLRTTDKELQVTKEQEEQLTQELHTARTAVDRICLPDLYKVMSPEKYNDMQMKGNLELCRSMLRLTDDQRALRAQIVELEDTVTSLNEQLRQAKESSKKNISFEEILKSERQVWETEKASLQHLNQQYEAETHRLRSERNTQQTIPGNAEVQQVYSRYLQSEHWRKALVWQKQYLMLVLKGYNDTEQHTLTRLTTMTTLPGLPSTSSHTHTRTLHSKARFRVAVFVVVAVCRMKHLVLRFQRKKRHCLGIHVMALSTASTPENPEPQSSSSSSVVRGRDAWPTSPPPSNERTLTDSFTGLTPPTREPFRRYTQAGFTTATHRSLFRDDSRELNQYVERLDNIHSVLGLTRKK